MAAFSAWLGFFIMMGAGLVSFSYLFSTFPISSSAPLMSSYSSGAVYSDLPIPYATEIRGYWRQGKDMAISNEKVGQVKSIASAKMATMQNAARGSYQGFKDKQAA